MLLQSAETTPFNASNAHSYNESTSTAVYDSLGTSRTLTTYFTKVSGSGSPPQWQTHWQLTDSSGSVVASGAGATMTFSSSGKLLTGSGTITVNNLPNGAAPLSIAEDFTGSTLSDLPFGVAAVTNDGHGAGELSGVQINANGDVIGQYSNGATQTFATIALASFANPQGLNPISGNMWTATTAAGTPTVGKPTTTGLGSLESGAIEGSNVDLSSQLVNLIAAQQAFQANVQGINIEQQNVQRLLTLQ